MSVDSDRLVQAAVTAYRELLIGSTVLSDEAVAGQLALQAESVTRAVARQLSSTDDDESVPDMSARIGSERARSRIHPTQSLRAASLMFEALFPVLADALEASGAPLSVVELGTALEREIQQRVAVGALPYVDYLLTSLLSSQHDERSRIARDLHDRISHGMGVALQQLDLFDHYRTRDHDRAEEHLAAARTSIVASVDMTRQLSADLWVTMPGDTLSEALASYLDSTAPEGTRTSLEMLGAQPHLPDEVAAELYLLIREAVRNALIHAHPTSIDIELIAEADLFRAVIRDNGDGFDVDAVTSAKPIGGLTSIRERAEMLGGRASITSIPGAGTTVDVHYPVATVAGQRW